MNIWKHILIAMIIGAFFCRCSSAPDSLQLLNASYDPTREFYREFNTAFARHWKAKKGEEAIVRQSHGGSGKQARSVIDGLKADVVTLALSYDIDAIAKKASLLPTDWKSRLPHNSAPYTSTIVFLVRKGNPKKIVDWDNLTRPGVSVITPNPKTSGGARWNYLAAWGYAVRKNGGHEARAEEFMKTLYKNVPVLDSGARGATTTFIERGMGDVLVTWENEAAMAMGKLEGGRFEIVYPSISILAEPPVALVDKVVDQHKTREMAYAYLEYLYSEVGQDIAARHHFRPRSAAIGAKYALTFPTIDLFTIDEQFGGWEMANKIHFADGGTFDRIYGEAHE